MRSIEDKMTWMTSLVVLISLPVIPAEHSTRCGSPACATMAVAGERAGWSC
jgi:hypothetical protein